MSCNNTPEQNEIIFNCAKGLLKITHAMKEINDEVSFEALQLSDKVLKLLEDDNCKCNEPEIFSQPIQESSELFKHPVSNHPVQEASELFKRPVTNIENNEDPAFNCHGHSNIPDGTTPPIVQENIDDEITSLVDKIRQSIGN